ncbi:hypothetical protein AB0M02_38655 [Actinoplanes sp. NPDC051861]|uniref:hypothetical protein n=1 Tax=Actinoplanes sp. NPDC051861 TaxID=3155170 RepID=UPI003415EA86
MTAEFALFYPWPPVERRSLSGWMKNVLLFFDGVALLAPPEALDRVFEGQEETVVPLLESGALRLLDPHRLIDDDVAQQLLDFLLQSAAGIFDRYFLAQGEHARLMSVLEETGGVIYESRQLGMYARRSVAEAAEMLWEELRRRGLVSELSADNSLRANPLFWMVYQALLAHLVRASGRRFGLDLHPVTDDGTLLRRTTAILTMPGQPSTGHVVQFDLDNIALDLTDAPLDEVLAFRDEHGEAFRRYRADLRLFTLELAGMDEHERAAAFVRRREELADAAEDLRRLGHRRWRRPAASIALGCAGAAWYGNKGVWDDSIITFLAGMIGASGPPAFDSAFSYLFAARDSLRTP